MGAVDPDQPAEEPEESMRQRNRTKSRWHPSVSVFLSRISPLLLTLNPCHAGDADSRHTQPHRPERALFPSSPALDISQRRQLHPRQVNLFSRLDPGEGAGSSVVVDSQVVAGTGWYTSSELTN